MQQEIKGRVKKETKSDDVDFDMKRVDLQNPVLLTFRCNKNRLKYTCLEK